MIEFMIIIALIWVVFAVVQDLKSREIANWLNFSLIIFALAFRLFYSVFSGDYNVIFFGLVGLGIFFVLGNLFYYARFFAGGDAKLFIALGSIIFFANSWHENLLIGLVFLIGLFLMGGIYSLIYSGFLAFNKRKEFGKEFKKEFYKNEKYAFLALLFAVIFIVLGIVLNELLIFIVAFMVFLLPIVYFYTKAVEQCCMIKSVNVEELTVGDWIVDEIKFKEKGKIKVIKPNWEGLSEEEIKLIKENYKKKVLVKYGIPFSPSFLLALLAIIIIKYFFSGNWSFLF